MVYYYNTLNLQKCQLNKPVKTNNFKLINLAFNIIGVSLKMKKVRIIIENSRNKTKKDKLLLEAQILQESGFPCSKNYDVEKRCPSGYDCIEDVCVEQRALEQGGTITEPGSHFGPVEPPAAKDIGMARQTIDRDIESLESRLASCSRKVPDWTNCDRAKPKDYKTCPQINNCPDDEIAELEKTLKHLKKNKKKYAVAGGRQTAGLPTRMSRGKVKVKGKRRGRRNLCGKSRGSYKCLYGVGQEETGPLMGPFGLADNLIAFAGSGDRRGGCDVNAITKVCTIQKYLNWVTDSITKKGTLQEKKKKKSKSRIDYRKGYEGGFGGWPPQASLTVDGKLGPNTKAQIEWFNKTYHQVQLEPGSNNKPVPKPTGQAPVQAPTKTFDPEKAPSDRSTLGQGVNWTVTGSDDPIQRMAEMGSFLKANYNLENAKNTWGAAKIYITGKWNRKIEKSENERGRVQLAFWGLYTDLLSGWKKSEQSPEDRKFIIAIKKWFVRENKGDKGRLSNLCDEGGEVGICQEFRATTKDKKAAAAGSALEEVRTIRIEPRVKIAFKLDDDNDEPDVVSVTARVGVLISDSAADGARKRFWLQKVSYNEASVPKNDHFSLLPQGTDMSTVIEDDAVNRGKQKVGKTVKGDNTKTPTAFLRKWVRRIQYDFKSRLQDICKKLVQEKLNVTDGEDGVSIIFFLPQVAAQVEAPDLCATWGRGRATWDACGGIGNDQEHKTEWKLASRTSIPRPSN
jgi:hypothetical protein